MPRIKSLTCVVIFAIAVAATVVSPGRAAVLLVDGSGTLLGAQNVDVSGTLYNVTFVDGTCIAIFSDCNELADFAFNVEANAQAAAQALLDQVLIDDVLGTFDSVPGLMFGCTILNGPCAAHIPFSTSVLTGVAINHAPPGTDIVNTNGLLSTEDLGSATSVGNANVYAVFSVVPVPPAVFLFGSALAGLIGLAGYGHRRHTASAHVIADCESDRGCRA